MKGNEITQEDMRRWECKECNKKSMTFTELIKRLFDLWCRNNWLRQIDRECKRRDNYYNKYKHSCFVAQAMYEEYEKIYGKGTTP